MLVDTQPPMFKDGYYIRMISPAELFYYSCLVIYLCDVGSKEWANHFPREHLRLAQDFTRQERTTRDEGSHPVGGMAVHLSRKLVSRVMKGLNLMYISTGAAINPSEMCERRLIPCSPMELGLAVQSRTFKNCTRGRVTCLVLE